jgi:hypothetical protein
MVKLSRFAFYPVFLCTLLPLQTIIATAIPFSDASKLPEGSPWKKENKTATGIISNKQ